jgi:hypothetical protein
MPPPNNPTILSYEPTPNFHGVYVERSPGCIRLRFGRTSRFFPGPPAIIQLDDILLTIEGVDSPKPVDADEFGLPPFFAVPRGDIREIKYVFHSGQLVIHATGHEMIEVRPAKDPVALQWIAGQLREALAEPVPAGRSFETPADLRSHVETEAGIRKANYQRQASLSSQLFRSLRTVLGSFTFRCSVC